MSSKLRQQYYSKWKEEVKSCQFASLGFASNWLWKFEENIFKLSYVDH